jgi:deazaflavin-dependent oxidoreductase (nitroreductase family)
MGVPSLIQRLGHRRWFAGLARVVVPPLDKVVGRLTRGRVVALGVIPSMLLTTTGRKTGQPRVSPLSYAKDGDSYVVIGSNFGQPNHPAWSANLLAHPEAVVTVGGRTIRVRATLAEDAERDRLWALLLAVWPAYATYAQRSGRHLRIFRLDRVR